MGIRWVSGGYHVEKGETMALESPAVWLKFHATIQCVACGQVVEIEGVNDHPDDLESTPELVVECPTCSAAVGYYGIPVVLLVGDQVAEVLQPEDEAEDEPLDPEGETEDDPGDAVPGPSEDRDPGDAGEGSAAGGG
jgi:hypothetical protein